MANKEYYEANREQLKEYFREYYQNNRERYRAQQADYYVKNRAKIIARNAAYRASLDAEQKKLYQKNYYQANKERFQAYYAKRKGGSVIKSTSTSKTNDLSAQIKEYQAQKPLRPVQKNPVPQPTKKQPKPMRYHGLLRVDNFLGVGA